MINYVEKTTRKSAVFFLSVDSVRVVWKTEEWSVMPVTFCQARRGKALSYTGLMNGLSSHRSSR